MANEGGGHDDLNELMPIKKFKRKLTPFLCHEMLYDYATGQLDEDRRSAVEEFLKTDIEGQRILEGIHEGLAYATSLSRTQISDAVATHLKQSENAVSIGRRYSSWSEWPETVRWSMMAIAASLAIAVVVVIVPWNKLSSLRLRPTAKPEATVEAAKVTPTNPTQQVAQNESSGDEPGDAEDAGGPGEDEGSGDDVADHAVPAAAAVAAVATPQPTPAKPAAPVNATTPQASPTPAAKVAAEISVPEGPKDPKAKGFVYRAFMDLSNLEEVAPKITESLKGFGAQKAGEVELGWKRGTGRYYHFSLPEDNEKKVLEMLQVYGPVRISKDPHPRVMPPGQVRFILWIESTDH